MFLQVRDSSMIKVSSQQAHNIETTFERCVPAGIRREIPKQLAEIGSQVRTYVHLYKSEVRSDVLRRLAIKQLSSIKN